MDFETALSAEARRTETETRWAFVGYIDRTLWTGVVIYRGARTRVISLRRASRKERRLYGETR